MNRIPQDVNTLFETLSTGVIEIERHEMVNNRRYRRSIEGGILKNDSLLNMSTQFIPHRYSLFMLRF